jgi:hypothetical protein
VLLELEVALALAGCGTCAELVDIPVGDTGAVVFSFRSAFPTVTFCASNVAFTPVAFTPVAFLEVVVVPLVVDGIMVFPMKLLLVGTIPFVVVVVDEFVLFCCANVKTELDANPTPTERSVIDNVIITSFVKFICKNRKYYNGFNGYSL